MRDLACSLSKSRAAAPDPYRAAAANVRSLSRMYKKLGLARVQPTARLAGGFEPAEILVEHHVALLAITARGRAGHSHPAGKPYPIEANPWSGIKWRSAF